MLQLTVLIFLFSPGSARASEWVFEPSTAAWGIFSERDVQEGSLNPRNSVARTPHQFASLELRPNWSLGNGTFKFTARPRFILEHQSVNASGTSSRYTDAFLRWSEGFASWNATEAFSFAYGMQNFQWGPAESAGPSNRIFRDTVQVKDSFYVVNGKHLLRASYAPSNSFSEVLLLELSGNGDPEPEPYERHAKKALLKSELSWNGGSNYAGLVLGWRDRNGTWLGEYLSIEPLEGLSLYTDLSHQAGSLAYDPTQLAGGRYTVFSQSRRGENRLYTFAVTGARYAFENGNDWRVEYLFQEAGYSPAQTGEARAALLSADPLQLVFLSPKAGAAARNGLDFPGRHYLYSSTRFPNSFGYRDCTLLARVLRSLQDSSTSLLASSESSVGDNGTFIVSLAASLGQEAGELKGAVDMGGTLAYRHAW